MIYSPQRQYLFIHIPKTGGTSMAMALEARAARDDVLVGDTPKAKRRKARLKKIRTRGRLWKHSTLADLDGLVEPDELQRLFVFTMVRNPWDRMVSYYHWLQDQDFDHPAVGLSKQLDFSGFLHHDMIKTSIRQNPYGSYMRMSPDGAERCDLFIRLENLAEDLLRLQAHLGFDIDLPVSNASRRQKDYRSYYSDENAEVISMLCAEDIARFSYSFDGP
ncbi:sulfotransferase family 2 domain-containing protein [Pseudaestuariivita rosea]|uniref:sulfotransferase family 2 domain-containing protein n=1 Tax=Pseudaestuariivita rosea TaxID=2763263 RepID=UPI001ABB36F8|nr:sulfotransferase family 2 domain-containing protein [Pseudaestuariivita rosea]